MNNISDQAIRQRALSASDSFIVQAPAGSGKTELLTQRYLVLLANAEKAPEEIVAITFTRKAAAEMRARILNALAFGETVEPDQDHYRHQTWLLANNVLNKDRRHQWQLLKNPNRLRIMTIDSLSAFLCRQTPLLTEWGAEPSIAENATEFYKIAVQRLLIAIINNNSSYQPALNTILLHLDNQVEKCEALLIELLSRRDQWLPHILLGLHNADNLRAALENSLQNIILEKLEAARAHLPENHMQNLLLLSREVGEYFLATDSQNPVAGCADLDFSKNITIKDFKTWLGLSNLLLTQEGEFRKTVDKRNGFLPKTENKNLMLQLLNEIRDCDAFKETLQDIMICPPNFYTENQWEILHALTELLPLLAAQLSLIFREKEQIDFVELNMAALKSLGTEETPTDLALYLDYQIRHLLIDEFQDTSVIHLQLLEKIIAGWSQDDGRTIFVVGDPMQSIYRFRNAEVGLFLRTQQNGLGGLSLTPLTLSMNFRSEKNIVDWFNQVFKNIFPKSPDIASGRIPYTASIAADQKNTADAVKFFPILNGDSKQEATTIVDQLEQCLQKNPHDSIAILVRARSQLIPITQLLQEKNIAFQAIDIEPLAERLEIIDCVSITRALMHRGDRVAWLAILRAPYCGLLLSDMLAVANWNKQKTIYEAILNAEKIENLSQDGLHRVIRIRSVFYNAFENRELLSFSAWVENTWVNLGGPATLSALTETQHIQAYFELLEKMTSNARDVHLDNLNENLKQLFAAPIQGDNARIQIMTIHKAKGLEFDHVFIPGLNRQTPHDSEKLFRWLEQPGSIQDINLILAPIKSSDEAEDAIYQYLKHVENKKLDHEMTRLLYVAITRAKKSCYLFAQITDKSPKKGSFLERLWPVLENEIKPLSTPLLQRELITAKNTTEQKFTRLTSNWQPPNNYFTQPIKEFKKVSINIDINIKNQQHKIIGTVIHELLEQSRYKHFSEKQCQSRLISLGLLQSQLDESMSIIQTAIKNILSDERAQWILAPHLDAQSEWQLSFNTNGEVKKYIIDRTFIYENNIRWIIDYKISAPEENEDLLTFLNTQRDHYESQLNQYAEILKAQDNRKIKLGLYFPLCKGWIAWEYEKLTTVEVDTVS